MRIEFKSSMSGSSTDYSIFGFKKDGKYIDEIRLRVHSEDKRFNEYGYCASVMSEVVTSNDAEDILNELQRFYDKSHEEYLEWCKRNDVPVEYDGVIAPTRFLTLEKYNGVVVTDIGDHNAD